VTKYRHNVTKYRSRPPRCALPCSLWAADFTTIALNVTGSKLIVSLDTDANGSVAVGAVGVPGLSLADATPLSATATDAVVEFKGAKDFSSRIGKTVAFEVKMSRATMFTLGFL
jgi:hypothetical protein